MHILPLLLAVALQVTTPVWIDAPPSMPKGTKMAILEGDTKAAGIFTIRLKVAKGAALPKHTHPKPERVTVLSGKVRVNIGGKETTFGAGGFYVNPPDEPHTVAFDEDSELQLTCEGPWGLTYVD